jgi:tRNA(Ile)-lysidine synthase
VHQLAKSVLGYVEKHELLRPGDRVGIAVSGGADSVALLRILVELRRELGIVLSVVHVNHKLRGAESDDDELFVRELADAYGLAFVAKAIDVKTFASEHKLSIEAGARSLRYDFFCNLLQKNQQDKVATAHSVDDQAETVLLKLARGAGTRGLAGIYPKLIVTSRFSRRRKSSGSAAPAIIRPLLERRRSDLDCYLREIGQSWREDSSNCQALYTRNRIRHDILPRLEEQVNPRAREALAEAAEIARAEEDFWAQKAADLTAQLWQPSAAGGTLLWNRVQGLELASQRRVVRAIAENLGLKLEFRHVEDLLGLGDNKRSVALSQGWSVLWQKGEIRFQRRAGGTQNYEYRLRVPGELSIPEAGIVICTAMTAAHADPRRAQPGPLLDARYAKTRLVVRNWRAGDRFWSIHSKGPKKLKELLAARHIIGEEKRCWPVVVSGNHVLWVRGFGIAKGFAGKSGRGVLICDRAADGCLEDGFRGS